MNKLLFLVATTLFFSGKLPAQNLFVTVNYATEEDAGKSKIYFLPNRLLTWDDFKGKPVKGSDAVALTDAGFGMKMKFHSLNNTSQLVITVSCSFSKNDSWVFPANKTSYILNHEQKHFDIAFIYTHLFIQNLRKAAYTNTNYSSLIEKIYNETVSAMSAVQDQYDTETAHSRIPEKQAEWDKKISDELALALKEQ